MLEVEGTFVHESDGTARRGGLRVTCPSMGKEGTG